VVHFHLLEKLLQFVHSIYWLGMFRKSSFHRVVAIPLAVGLVLNTVGLLEPGRAVAQNDEQTNIRVYRQVSPAVVSIQSGQAVGSGSILTAEGLILTNAHVVGSSASATVTLADGRKFPGRVVGYGSNSLDLALIQLQGAKGLPTIKLARSGVQVGQRAFAIGNPFGQFQGTFTTGIVSRVDTRQGLIQTDAAINPGNSGGPLLNSSGEQVGVNTAIFTSGENSGNIGIGFAISVDKIQPFLTAYRQGKLSAVAQGNAGIERRSRQSRQSVKIRQLPLNGQVISARLGTGDPVLPPNNSYVNIYAFSGTAGQQIRIRMASGEIEPGLILISPKGRPIGQVGANGKNRVSLMGTLPLTGNYLVLANSLGAKEAGRYQINAITD
jgi:S1-C subfamily serine protease